MSTHEKQEGRLFQDDLEFVQVDRAVGIEVTDCQRSCRGGETPIVPPLKSAVAITQSPVDGPISSQETEVGRRKILNIWEDLAEGDRVGYPEPAGHGRSPAPPDPHHQTGVGYGAARRLRMGRRRRDARSRDRHRGRRPGRHGRLS